MCGILFIASPECIVDGVSERFWPCLATTRVPAQIASFRAQAADAAVPADYSGLLTARGPDYQHAITVRSGPTCCTAAYLVIYAVLSALHQAANGNALVLLQVQHGSTRLLLGATLLQLRGRSPSTCPLQDSQGNLLAFNGEIFGGLHVPAGCNDGHALLDALSSCADEGMGSQRCQ
jgi:hypothetical protein